MTKTGKDIMLATIVAVGLFQAWAFDRLGYWDRVLIGTTASVLGWAVAREVSARQREAVR